MVRSKGLLSSLLALSMASCGGGGSGEGAGIGQGAAGQGGVGAGDVVGPGGGSSTSTVPLTTTCDAAAPYQLCRATRADAAPLGADRDVAVTLGGKPAVAAVAAAELVFMIPAEAVGSALELVVELDASTHGKASIDVASIAVDVDLELATFEDAIMSRMAAIQAAIATDGGSPADVANIANEAAKMEAAFDDLVAAPADVRAANAAFFAVNGEAVLTLLDGAFVQPKSLPLSKLSKALISLNAQAAAGAAFVSVGSYAIAVTIKTPSIITGIALGILIGAGASLLHSAITDWNVASLLDGIPTSIDIETHPSFGPPVADSGIAQSIAIKVVGRNIQLSDAGSALPWLAAAEKSRAFFAGWWGRFFPKSPAFSYAAPSTSKLNPEAIGDVQVVVDAGSATADLGGTADAPTITFSTTSATSVDVTYHLEYAKGGFSATSPLSSTTVFPGPGCDTVSDPNGIQRTCYGAGAVVLSQERCQLVDGSCKAWSRTVYWPGGTKLKGKISGSESDQLSSQSSSQTWSESHYDDQGRTLRSGGYTQYSDGRVGTGGQEFVYGPTDLCRFYKSFEGDGSTFGCDTGFGPCCPACHSCEYQDGGPVFTFAETKAISPLDLADVTIVHEGLCGNDCPYTN